MRTSTEKTEITIAVVYIDDAFSKELIVNAKMKTYEAQEMEQIFWSIKGKANNM